MLLTETAKFVVCQGWRLNSRGR